MKTLMVAHNKEGQQVMEPVSVPVTDPLHIRRLESALDMRPFLAHAKQFLSQNFEDSDDDDDDDADSVSKLELVNFPPNYKPAAVKDIGRGSTKQEREWIRSNIYNFNDLTEDREWLYKVLICDTDSSSTDISDEDEYVKKLLRTHVQEQKIRDKFYKKPSNIQYAYYGAGLLSNVDMYPDHQQSIVGVRKRRRRTKQELMLARLAQTSKPKKLKVKAKRQQRARSFDTVESGEVNVSDLGKYAFADTVVGNETLMHERDSLQELSGEPSSDVEGEASGTEQEQAEPTKGKEQKPARKQASGGRASRKRLWRTIVKKKIPRVQRQRLNALRERLVTCKRIVSLCQKSVRQTALQSQRVMRDSVYRSKRMTREMLSYWKRFERSERDNKRRLEKEAEEQRKHDIELIEAKRQQRKLNYLLAQSELYAHFMSKKLGQGSEEDQLNILNQLDEEANPRLAAYDDYDAEAMKLRAKAHVTKAVNVQKELIRGASAPMKQAPVALETKALEDLPQPTIFQGTLKAYQIKGMTWLANLYDQGISGILADEMGLGKTVQSIACLCHIAETYGVWGPFLIISPASTLHNWQQELQRFVPDFKVVPYWGSPSERKILRQFWEQKNLHTREASFHVVVTSYQLIVSDYKYFNRIKWQYMVLDEAQAIKSSTSQRWKLLLGFSCRNRLLLSGTPIQNSMAELWALLHFIMPTLFDSHDEFNEWFSKDIESHAENKTGIDEKQISRLHMILKPFMLRRIKKDVENELSDKVEIMVYCPLTTRQKLLYIALKKKIRLEDLMNLTSGGGGRVGSTATSDRNFTSNLLNLVMQFRKVCNHPELFERRDAKSPFCMAATEYEMPRLIFDDGLLYRALPSKQHLLYNRFQIFKAAHVHRRLFGQRRYIDLHADVDDCFGFLRLTQLDYNDIEDLTLNGLFKTLLNYRARLALYARLAYRYEWWPHYRPSSWQLLQPSLANKLCKDFMLTDSVLHNLLFTAQTINERSVYTFGDYKTFNMQETIEHRIIRSKNWLTKHNETQCVEVQVNVLPGNKSKTDNNVTTMKLLTEFPHKERKPMHYECAPLELPRFLYGLDQRAHAPARRLYCNSRAAEWAYIRHMHCEHRQAFELVNEAVASSKPPMGWSSIVVPDKETLISDAGKLAVLDNLLTRLKAGGHRVLIYSQMTKMIDLLEEYMWHRKHRYMRLDGSSKISARRDMVADFQNRQDIFVFLLSTRAGGLGINLTAADTVIFYDSDWNPTVDQQAMDRAHRLGQKKQVTVYRLICKGTIEERILQRAREKSEIQRMVISGGNFKPDTLKPKEVVSLLLEDEEFEVKYRQKTSTQQPSGKNGNSSSASSTASKANDRKRKPPNQQEVELEESSAAKKLKLELDEDLSEEALLANEQNDGSYVPGATTFLQNPNDSDTEQMMMDVGGNAGAHDFLNDFGNMGRTRRRHHPRGTKRGRPRGSGRRGGGNGTTQRSPAALAAAATSTTNDGNGNDTLQTSTTVATPLSLSSGLKRGPGRPRLKTTGPISRGVRGATRGRRPMRHLFAAMGRGAKTARDPNNPSLSLIPQTIESDHDDSSTEYEEDEASLSYQGD